MKGIITLINDNIMALTNNNGTINTPYHKDRLEAELKSNAKFMGHLMDCVVKSITKLNDTTWEVKYQKYTEESFAKEVFAEMGL